MKAPARSPALPAVVPLAEVEAMIVRRTDLRHREPGKERRADYQAALDRLHALAYRLAQEAKPGRTVGLQKPPAVGPKRNPSTLAQPVAAETKAFVSPQGTLRLGPAIVIARKPRPR